MKELSTHYCNSQHFWFWARSCMPFFIQDKSTQWSRNATNLAWLKWKTASFSTKGLQSVIVTPPPPPIAKMYWPHSSVLFSNFYASPINAFFMQFLKLRVCKKNTRGSCSKSKPNIMKCPCLIVASFKILHNLNVLP